MPEGIVRSGDYRKGTPVVLPKNFGHTVTSPEPFGNVMPQANATLNSNPVTWAPSPAHFGNGVGFLMQTRPGVVIVSQGSSGTSSIVITNLLGTTSATLTYSGAPAGVTLAFSPNPDLTTSTITITVGSTVPAGIYLITIIGTSGTEIENSNLRLVVTFSSGSSVSGFELENGSGVLLLEDGVSILLLEQQ